MGGPAPEGLRGGGRRFGCRHRVTQAAPLHSPRGLVNNADPNTLRRHPPYALPEDPIDDVLKQMNDHWLTVIPVVDKETRDFLGTVTRHDILDMVTLMDEIAAELKVANDGRRT